MRNVPLRLSAVVVCAIAILCSSVVAHAQTVDGTFDPGANQIVNTIAMQPDGKVVVGGNFTGLGGVTGTTPRNHIGRINTDGTVDAFNPGINGPVYALAVQPDGKILAGGNFLSAGGGDGLLHPRSRIVRFNDDGSVDTTFNPGANLNVYALAVQADGKILVGGNFSTLGGAARIAIGRLNADGSIDSGFNPGASKLPSPGAPPEIYAIVVQPDGNILLGGYFNGLGGGTGTTPRNFIGRLLANGDVDSFNPGVTSIGGVTALALQADGKIVVGGTYTQLGGSNRANIGRLDANGALDIGFNPGAETQVNTLTVQTDGKILVGGYFKWMGDAGGPLKSVRNYIGRLNANGTVDGSFAPGANNAVNVVALHANGAIVVGGIFDRLGNGASLVAGVGTLRNRIGRITNTDAGLQTLTLSSDGTVETWLRSGGGPEVSRVTFEFSFDGSFYSLLGEGGRIDGGWQLTSVNLPTTRRMWVRARGYHESGRNGSGSIVESILVLGSETYGDYDGDGKSDHVVFRPSTGTWYTLGSLASTVTPVQFGLSSDIPVPGDYDGDGFTNLAVYRPGSGTWFIRQDDGLYSSIQFGLVGDVPVPNDYDGDQKTDVAVYRPSSHEWFIFQSSTNTVVTMAFGIDGDVPVPADYDGDGKSDVAMFRPSTGEWFIRQSSSLMIVSIQFGLNIDVPVPGDYDGDDKADIAIFRPATGAWFILQSSTNSTSYVTIQWGQAGDIAQPGDYDGDGKYDLAVFRPSNATWYIKQSTTGYATAAITQLGLTGDVAVPSAVMANAITGVQSVTQPGPSLANLTPFNDFDGDGQADITVFRPSTGTWFNLYSGANYSTSTSTQFGLPGDVPVPGDYDGDDKADIAIYRPNSGTWYILKSSDSTFSATQWGVSGDVPVPGDYDGDGRTDIAIFRSGTWYILQSSDSTLLAAQWGVSGDIPAPGDHDGDGRSDITVFRPSSGTWYIRKSIDATLLALQWGLSTDVTVPGDYDGDGKSDIAVFRPSTGTWYIRKSSDSALLAHAWGVSGDIAVPGDYDGDGKTDIAVFRPTAGTWYFLKSSSNNASSGSYQFGQNGDIPILKRP